MGVGKTTIGYSYFFSIHQGIGRGPLNEIADIRAGDISMIDTPICIPSEGILVEVNKPDLFGGETKEGGIKGPLFIYSGARDQELQGALASGVGTLPSIADSLGGDVPNFRGVTTAWYDGLICSLNPYPKEWSWRVRRTTAGWFDDDPWYPEKATVSLVSNGKDIRAMNAIHMLYEINTNPEWGRGMPRELLDENSYIRAANQLCDEQFGLCIPWFRQENIKEFIPIIINHIAAVQYVDRQTGLMTVRLIRNDYVEEDLPLYTPDTGLLEVQDDDASGEDTAFNEIIVKGFDPTTKEDIAVRWHNLASIQNLGEIISNTIEYRGLSTRDLVARVAEREGLMQLPMRRMTLTFDRRAWKIAPGEPFKISFPSKGIANMVVRAGEINDGTLKDGRIVIKVVQEVFSMPSTSYVEPTDPVWTPPDFTPAPSPESVLWEANWRDFYRLTDAATQDAVAAGASYVGTMAKKPTGVQSQEYDLATRTGADPYEVLTVGPWTAWLTLAADIEPLDATLTVEADNRAAFMNEFVAGMAVVVGDEQIEFTAFDDGTGIATIKRGVADTIPAAHVAGVTIWLIDDELISDGKEYEDGETVYAKVLTRTSTAVLDEADATELDIEVNQRLLRPYPPADVEVDAISIYDPTMITDTHSEPVVTWVERNRLTQADQLVGHTEAGVAHEVGTTYTIRIFDADGVTLFRTDAAATSGWQYDSAMQVTDGAGAAIWLELEAVRDTLVSHQFYRRKITLNFALEIDGDLVLIDGDRVEF